MPTETIGPFVIDGPPAQAGLIGRALDRLDQDVSVDRFITNEFEVVFGDVPNVPGTNSPAWGFFRGGNRRLLIRHGMSGARNLRKNEVEYTFMHEAFGHGGELDGALNEDKRRDILTVMGVPLAGVEVISAWRRGATPEGAGVRYWSRPYEAYCDMLVAAITDIPAIFERRYKWDIDPDQLKQIVLGGTTTGSDPNADPDPDPFDQPSTNGCEDVQADLYAMEDERNRLAVQFNEVKARLAGVSAGT